MLIGLSGPKGSGKDTVGAYLIRKYGFKRLSFADKLKESVSELFDIPREWVDEYKSDPDCYVAIGWEREPAPSFTQVEGQPSKMWSPMTKLKLREFLQRYGTESHREVFGFDFWVDAVLEPEQGSEWHRGNRYVITDVRFTNEGARIMDQGGYLLHITRPGYGKDDPHLSEGPLPPHWPFATIDNSADMYYLEERVDEAIEAIIQDEKVHGWRSEGDM